ncbi:NAD-dependent epimerase/dehydratase family protein [Umezawaea endophytica]|uniref:Epimerase n=1 Tax=Umezawaea endophytica TaxID=1654476 RepID=A0A9X2VSC0_9PSEU|nr:NAD-dependent epimerase/dehydratase family protein [Umezawaea endophytica]MCS7481744.1 epimerase [Umezawaea endophytica]
MKVIVFGASGMVGQGVLRECLVASDVESVLSIGRRPTGKSDPKLTEVIHTDFSDLSPLRDQLTNYDACFFCLGVSSVGMNEPDYTRITYDFTLAAARLLSELNPNSTFIYVSGAGTDTSEKGRQMWARVKGKTENDVMALSPRGYAFRPGYIQPLHGVVSPHRWANRLYKVFGPAYPLLNKLFPKVTTTTENLGLAMLDVARTHPAKKILYSVDFNAR